MWVMMCEPVVTGGPFIAITPDLATDWSLISTPADSEGNWPYCVIQRANGRFIAGAFQTYGTDHSIITSDDGATWVVRDCPLALSVQTLVDSGSRLVAGGLDGIGVQTGLSIDDQLYPGTGTPPGNWTPTHGASFSFGPNLQLSSVPGGGTVTAGMVLGSAGWLPVNDYDALNALASYDVISGGSPADFSFVINIWVTDGVAFQLISGPTTGLSFFQAVGVVPPGMGFTHAYLELVWQNTLGAFEVGVSASFAPIDLYKVDSRMIATSDDDGHSWTLRTTPLDRRTLPSGVGGVTDGVWNGTEFGVVVTGAFGGPSPEVWFMSSPDGVTWTPHLVTSSGRAYATVTYDRANGLWVVGDWDGHIHTSPDGVIWTLNGSYAPPGGGADSVVTLASSSSLSVVGSNIGPTSLQRTNSPASNWTLASSQAASGPTNRIRWDGQQFIALGRGQYGSGTEPLLVSADGDVWTFPGGSLPAGMTDGSDIAGSSGLGLSGWSVGHVRRKN